jgi:hypothetical protein
MVARRWQPSSYAAGMAPFRTEAYAKTGQKALSAIL